MAEDGAVGERERGGHEAAPPFDVGVADGIHTEVERVKPSDLHAVGDLAPIEAERDELPPCDGPELPSSNPSDEKVDWALSFIHVMNKGAHPNFSPPSRRKVQLGGRFSSEQF